MAFEDNDFTNLKGMAIQTIDPKLGDSTNYTQTSQVDEVFKTSLKS